MHILILGGSGRVGSLVVTEALSRSHTVTALIRDTKSLAPQPGLTIIQGTPLSLPDIETAFRATPSPPTGVIVALNSQRTSDNPFAASIAPPKLMLDSTANVVTAMRKFDCKRIVSLSAYGVGSSNGTVFWPVRMMMNYSNMKIAYQDHEMVESLMKSGGKEEGIRWTGVKPAMLTEGVKKDVKVFGEKGEGAGVMPSISKSSVANWLVDCVEGDEEWVGRTPVIAN
jgi:nucleoside-diphosphate-sugar epimerase